MYFALVGTNWSYACPAPTKSVKLELSQTHPKKNASILQLVVHIRATEPIQNVLYTRDINKLWVKPPRER